MAKIRLSHSPYPPEPGWYCGWYSEQQARIGGIIVYRVFDTDVFVTMITETVTHNTPFADMEFVGFVKDLKIARHSLDAISDFSVRPDFVLHENNPDEQYFKFAVQKNRKSVGFREKFEIRFDPIYEEPMANKKIFGKTAEEHLRGQILNNIGVPKKKVEERSSESPEPRFSVTEFYMEASSYVKHQMWKMRTDSGTKYNSDWKDETSGFVSQIKEINGFPVNVTFFWSNIAGKRVLFYDFVSMMIDRQAALAYIKNRCMNAKPWPEPDIEKPQRQIGQIINADDPRFSEVVCAVEANRIEYALCVKQNYQDFSSWVAESRVFIDFPDIDGKKAYAHLSFDRIEGKLVCFWDGCSEVFNVEEIAKLFGKNGTTKTTNCENFGVCKTQVRS